jgi:WD40 repeat protein
MESIEDGEWFILHFFDAIELSASHIYESAIYLSPKHSIVRRSYQRQLPHIPSWNAVDDNWGACSRSIQLRNGRCIAFSHQGDLVAACGGCREHDFDNFLVIIEAATGMILSTLKDHQDDIHCVAFSPDDSLLASGSEDGTIDLWDAQTGGLVRRVKMANHVQSVGFSHDGTMMACNFGIWDRALAEVVHEFEQGVTKLAWSPNNADVILGYESGGLKILDATRRTYREIPSAHDRHVKSVAYSRDGLKVASGSSHMIKVHDAETGNVLHKYPIDDLHKYSTLEDVHSGYLAFSHDGDRLVIAHKISMIIRDLGTSVDIATFQQPSLTNSVSVSPDGMSIALAADDKLSIWQMDGPLISPSDAAGWHSGEAMSVAISPDSTFITSGSNDETVKLWDSATGACFHTFNGHSNRVCSVAISPDSSLVASASFGGRILVWRVADRALVSTFHGHASFVSGVSFSPDGRLIASVSECGEVGLWEIAGETMIGTLGITSAYYPSIGFSGDGTGITLFNTRGEGWRSWEMAPRTASSLDANPDELPIAFIPQDRPFQNHSVALYKYDRRAEWITDQHNRRVLWLPADLRGYDSCCQGSRIVIGTLDGRVLWFDFGLPSID